MARRIRIELGDEVGYATLYEEKSPATCNAIWEALPITYPHVLHARFSGEEAFFPLESLLTGKLENQLYDTQPGDIGYFVQGPSVCIYYGQLVVRTPGNVFARITENWEGLYRVCKRTWKDHNIAVKVTRAEEGRN
jgi:hypothetical protein